MLGGILMQKDFHGRVLSIKVNNSHVINMSDLPEEKINEEYLYTLRVGDNNRFYTYYLAIDKSLLDECDVSSFYEIIEKFSDNDLPDEGLRELKENETINFFKKVLSINPELMGHRDYCSKYALRSAFCQYQGIYNYSDLRFMEGSYSYNIHVKPSPDASYCDIKDFTNDFFQSYFIEKAYASCKDNITIKAFSHRQVGWHTFSQKLNDIFSVELHTNFGFGSSSYFAITIILDEIRIIPYSILVIYRYANTLQLLRNTRAFSVSDISWKHSFDFIRDACNEFQMNGKESFISKYIINECEILTKILPEFLKKDTFPLSKNYDGSFYDADNESVKVTINGYSLIVFRSEKIAGAIEFFDSINNLSRFIPVAKYLNCIIICSKEIIPCLEDEVVKLKYELNELKSCIVDENEKLSLLEEQKLELKQTLNSQTQEQLKALLKLEEDQSKKCSQLQKTFKEYETYLKEIEKNRNKIISFAETHQTSIT